MKYIKLYEQHNKGITFKQWLIDNPQDINIIAINCNYFNLIDLEGIQQFTNLKYLYCFDNNLTELPDLPGTLQYLSCHSNNLTSLPELPNSLNQLSCGNNKLTSLPELPDSLKFLHCENNKLSSLPELPDSLTYLNCHSNNLSSLPELPNSLKTLFCYNNDLPYEHLKEYKKWHKKTYPYLYKAKNYNI